MPSNNHKDDGLGALFDMHSEGVGRQWVDISHTFSEVKRQLVIG